MIAAFLRSLFLVAVIVTVFGCGRNPFKPKPQNKVNYGSCILAVHSIVLAVREYAVQNGHLPPKNTDLRKSFSGSEGGVNPDLYGMVEYGGNESLTLKSPERTIVLKCNQKDQIEDGSVVIYCALLSGEVIAIPEKLAELGKVCPAGVGEQMMPKP
jgi:hypothetical protein